jgi:hypothetical protein
VVKVKLQGYDHGGNLLSVQRGVMVSEFYRSYSPQYFLILTSFTLILITHKTPVAYNSMGDKETVLELLGIASIKAVKEIKQKKTNKLHGLSPRANYTDRATAASRRSDCQLLRIKGATWSA